MLLFYYHRGHRKRRCPAISIHQMLLFYPDNLLQNRWFRSISIHQMLLFYKFDDLSLFELIVFQYIKCYYSTEKVARYDLWNTDFNTSNVTILPDALWKGALSLRNFNTSNVTILHPAEAIPWRNAEFQYIKCYYSTEHPEQEWEQLHPFQYIKCYYSTIFPTGLKEMTFNFNTSNVTILHEAARETASRPDVISIHQMLLFYDVWFS